MDSRSSKNESGNTDQQKAALDAALKSSEDARDRAEKDLRQLMHVFRGIIESIDSHTLIFSVNRHYRYTSFNSAHARVMKTIYDADIKIGHSLLDYMTMLEDREKAKQNIDRALAGERVKQEAFSGEEQHARLLFEVLHSPIEADDEIIGVSIIARDITGRRQAEDAQKMINQRNEMILNSAGEGIYGTDINGNILFINPSAAKMLGFETREMIGKNSHRLFHHSKADGSPYPIEECPLHKSLEQGEVYRGQDEVFWTRDGNRFYVEHINTPLIGEGKIAGAVVVFRDIAERKEAEKAIRSANAYNRSLIDASLDPLVTISRDGKITDVNHATETVTGLSREKLIGTDFADYFTEPDKAQAGYKQVFSEGLVQDYELGIRHADGHVTPVIYNASLYTDETGGVAGVFAAARDISELRQADEALRKSEEKFRVFFESEPEYCYLVSPQGIIEDVNQSALNALGYSHDELIGKPIEIIYSPEQLSRVQKLVERWKKEEILRDEELIIQTKAGEKRNILLSVSMARDASGGILHSISVQRDITERKKTENILKESEARLNEAQRIARIGNWELDTVNNILTWSDEIYRMFEIDPSEFGASYEAFLGAIHPEDREAVDSAYTNSLKTRAPYAIEHRLLLPDGRIKFIHERCETFYDADGKPIRSVGTVQDVTERKQLEQQLIESQKMESIGRLAGGVAHDFNNFLTAIRGYIDIASGELPPGSPAGEDLVEARAASDRAADLARQLLLFGRREPIEMKPVYLNQMIGGLLKILGHLIGEQYSLKTELDDDLWNIEADTGHLEQVLMNLVVNARDAIEEGGTIVVRTGNVNLDPEIVKIKTGSTKRRFVELAISDSGIGMDEQTKSSIFEPFFTTKEKGKGTGLGLSVVYGIVAQHGGWVDVDSAPGKGSTFTIYLPASKSALSENKVEKIDRKVLLGKGERVLLVEDDESIRKLAARMLSGNGYQVEVAVDAETAIDIFEREAGGFDLVFSDVILPGMDGVKLCESLLTRKPGLGVLLASGYSDEISLEIIRQKGFPFIHKPYDIQDLLQIIRDELVKKAH